LAWDARLCSRRARAILQDGESVIPKNRRTQKHHASDALKSLGVGFYFPGKAGSSFGIKDIFADNGFRPHDCRRIHTPFGLLHGERRFGFHWIRQVPGAGRPQQIGFREHQSDGHNQKNAKQ
jgi:hypothetical protein